MKLIEIVQSAYNNLSLKPGDTLASVLSRDMTGAHNIIKDLFMDNDKLTTDQYKKLMALRLSRKHSFDTEYAALLNIDDFVEDSTNDEMCAALIVPYSERYQGVVLPMDKMIFSVSSGDSDLEYWIIQPNHESTKSGSFSLKLIRSALGQRQQHLTNTTGIQYRIAIFTENPQL